MRTRRGMRVFCSAVWNSARARRHQRGASFIHPFVQHSLLAQQCPSLVKSACPTFLGWSEICGKTR